MNNRELEQRLGRILSQSAPNDFEDVLSCCKSRKGTIIQMTTRKKRPVFRNLIAACLALVLVGGGGAVCHQAYAVSSVVSLDINPSIELKINQNEKILACNALNADAQAVLADMDGGADLKGAKLNVAVNAIVGALVRNGYLDSISSAILISVEDKDQDRAAKLRQELTATVDIALKDRASDAAVLSQAVVKDTTLEKKAKENNISTGKAALIDKILSLNASLSFEGLAALSVEELKDLAETGATKMPIGKTNALQLAKEYAGVKDADLTRSEVDAELDDIPPHYEVELYTSEEFEYKVDAYSGEILVGQKDILSLKPAGTPDQPPKDNTTQPPAAPSAYDADQAVASALAHAGLTSSQVSGLTVEKDTDDGREEYEIEFKANGFEYDYTIDAETGAILEHEKDYDD